MLFRSFSFKKKSSAKKYTKKKAVTTTKKRKKGNAPNRAKFKKQKKQGGGACFIENSLILTEDGLVEIDEIEVGDFVWSENPETGDITLKEVKETFVNKTDILVYITVNNETIKTTEGHLFYVEDIGWIPASMLKEGDVLSLEDGRELPIQSIKEVTYSYYINVYNFEVKDYHTYYVSDESILVHNMCYDESSKKGSKGVKLGGSKTLWQNGKTERVDVENPDPGVRAGSLHYHESNNNKWEYDNKNKLFYNVKTKEIAPKKVQKKLKDKNVIKALEKGLKILGED